MCGLVAEARQGLWQVIRADQAVDAWAHAIAVARNGHTCELGVYCEDSGVTPLALGTWSEAVACALAQIPKLTPATPPEARVPVLGFDYPV
jgi:hypothetical protein